MGGRAILYMNGRLVDPGSEYWQRGGEKDILDTGGGKPLVENYNTSVDFRVACPGALGYRQKITSELRNMIREYGCHAIQLDQVACNDATNCFATSHDHRKPSTSWFRGTRELLQEIQYIGRAHDPGFFTWAEGCADRLGQYYEVNQGHGEESGWGLVGGFPEMFHYTFPEWLTTGSCLDTDKLCHTFIQGKPIDIHLHQLEEESFCRLVRDFVRVRSAFPGYYLRGRFVDTVAFEVVGEKVLAEGIKREDGGGLLVGIWNKDGQKKRVTLKSPFRGRHLRVVYPESMSRRFEGQVDLDLEGRVTVAIIE